MNGLLWALIAAIAAAVGAPIGFAAWLAFDWTPVAAGVAGGAGVAVTAAGAWAGVRRQRSGSIETSEAADLWGFSRDLMRDLREDLVRARERVAVLEAAQREDRARIADLEAELRQLRRAAGA